MSRFVAVDRETSYLLPPSVDEWLGNIALDGTKVHANASKHKALSWAHANKIEAQLRQEVQELLALGEKADGAAVPD